jgi:hypothetical protein
MTPGSRLLPQWSKLQNSWSIYGPVICPEIALARFWKAIRIALFELVTVRHHSVTAEADGDDQDSE